MDDWQYCSYYFKLKHIEKLLPFESSIYTCWGKLVHKWLQNSLEVCDWTNGSLWTRENAINLIRTWVRFCRLYKKPEIVGWARSGAKAVDTIAKLCKEEFGNFKVLYVEERLALPSGKWPQTFKGFIDMVLELEDGRIILIDFKSCKSGFTFNKFRDKFKDYQLTLYKHFYSLKHGVDPKLIETYFITIERPEKAKKPVSFVRVTSGPKKVQNALAWLQTALGAINEGHWIKNRASCHKYGEKYPCAFFGTDSCTR